MKHRIVIAAACALALAAACSKHRPLRFGSLQADKRAFNFEHGIELLEAENGMTIALLEDPRTNLVTVDVRYTVGAAEDPPGRAGMAHLVEHLLFLSRTEPGDATLGDRLGEVALYYNAATNHDETHYSTIALDEDLERVLELEARRMEFTCDQLDEDLFLRERDVVLEEEAQRAGPNDETRLEIARAVWGKKHPYARGVGTREVADATRQEACDFVDAHYAPDRAILVVTGNFDSGRTAQWIGKRFGPIARKSKARRTAIYPPELEGFRTSHVADVDEATALVFFPSPAWGGDEYAPWQIASTYLAIALDDADDEHDWITSTGIGQTGGWREPATTVQIAVDDPAKLEDAVELVYAKADELKKRIESSSLDQIRGPMRSTYMASWDQFVTRGGWLADFLQYTDHNWFFLAEMAAFEKLDGPTVQAWASRNLRRERSHVALVRPSGKAARDRRVSIAAAGKDHEVRLWRTPVDPDEATRPVTSRTTRVATRIVEDRLDNGLRVLLAPDPDSPIVVARMMFPVGSAADPADRRGLAQAAASLLDHDTDRTYRARDVTLLQWVLALGTDLRTWVDERATAFEARGLALHADWHVWRLFWLLDLGRYAGDDINAMHRRFGDDDDDPDVRDRALRAALFGESHPYAAPPMRASDAKKLGARDLQGFRAAYYRASGATLIVTGGFEIEPMRAEIAELFGAWAGDPPAAAPSVPAIDPAAGPTWIGVRDEEVSQPRLTIAFATSSDPAKDRAARLVLQKMLEDRARVVREGMGATYGVSIGYQTGAGGSTLLLDAALDPDRTGKAMNALLAEIATLRDRAGELAEDFVRARRRALADALADSAGAVDLAIELTAVVRGDLPLDYFTKLAGAIGATTLDDVAALAAGDLAEARMVVVLSGRAEVIEPALASTGATARMLDEE